MLAQPLQKQPKVESRPEPSPFPVRLYPPVWDHQRYTLVELRKKIEHAIAEYFPLTGKETVVDIGCGERPYAPLFLKRGCRYIGCDLDDSADVKFIPGKPIPLSDKSADIVVSFQVLEHVWDLDWYLGECRRLLKPEGRLLLSTHGTWLYHPHPTDFRRWTRDGLRKELESRGFKVESVSSAVGPLAWCTQFRLLGLRHALIKIPWIGKILFLPIACVMNGKMWLEDRVTPKSITDVNASVYITVSIPN